MSLVKTVQTSKPCLYCGKIMTYKQYVKTVAFPTLKAWEQLRYCDERCTSRAARQRRKERRGK